MSDDSSISELENTVERLQRRIGHLEQELQTSYDEAEFKSRLNSLTPEHAEYEVKDNRYGGYHAHVTGVQVDDLNYIIDMIDERQVYDNYDWKVTETSEGLGVEIFTEVY